METEKQQNKEQKDKKTGIAISSIGANRAIAAGAYAFALSRLDDNAHNRF